ncbi:MAG: hypothetical protein PHS48_09500, partial [Bacteroidales bacterium]|nr:hypothetical protein [Bacteroidales bacterium]
GKRQDLVRSPVFQKITTKDCKMITAPENSDSKFYRFVLYEGWDYAGQGSGNIRTTIHKFRNQFITELKESIKTNPDFAHKTAILEFYKYNGSVRQMNDELGKIESSIIDPNTPKEKIHPLNSMKEDIEFLISQLEEGQRQIKNMVSSYWPEKLSILDQPTPTLDPYVNQSNYFAKRKPGKRLKKEITYESLFKIPYNQKEKLEQLDSILELPGYIDDKHQWIGLTDKANEFAALYQCLKENYFVTKIKDEPTIPVFGKRFGLKIELTGKDLFCTIRNITTPAPCGLIDEFDRILRNW